jgi:murein DD-endopeptidase MepM/ murein hydrolase activator NlpD
MQVPHTLVQSFIGASSVVVLAIVVLGVAALARGVNITRNRTLEGENRVLLGEIARLHERLAIFRDTLNVIGQRDQELRLLAGLNPLDPAVQAGGIGGPPGAWSERDTLAALGADGAQAFAVRLDADGLGRRANILVRSIQQAYESLASHQAQFAATPSIMPTHGLISSPFATARLDPILHIVRPHQGIDVAAPAGTEIDAPAAGVVKDVKWEDGYGNVLTIDHGYGVVTRYAHCSKILVVPGQSVTRGQRIALTGSTGESTGPHLHYEVWVNGKAVDPKTFVLPDNVITD